MYFIDNFGPIFIFMSGHDEGQKIKKTETNVINSPKCQFKTYFNFFVWDDWGQKFEKRQKNFCEIINSPK